MVGLYEVRIDQILTVISSQPKSPSAIQTVNLTIPFSSPRAIRPIFLAWVPRYILNDASLEFWYTTREKFFGMPVDQLEKEKGGVLAWNEAEPALRGATALLKENQGPFFLGETVSYADLVWASVLIFSKRLGPGFFEEALKRSGDAQVHLNLLEALRPVSERDGN
jgi:glutathione S-transferase